MDWNLIAYVILSVLAVSAVSLIGIFTFFLKNRNFDKIILYVVSFSVGAIFGDVFIHLLPEAFRGSISISASLFILIGILFSFVMEKFIHWRHCHAPQSRHHHHVAYMNLVGDALHNFIDGLVIAGSYFVAIHVGFATTLAVLFHEIPHELGNFGILIYSGFSKAKALLFNFLSALTALLGAITGILLSNAGSATAYLVPFAAGNLIYIAGTDLIPELHKSKCEDFRIGESTLELFFIMLGIGFMLLMLLFD